MKGGSQIKLMARPFTVYFDTNFFVWSCGADEETANEIISQLNTLKVRHVLSDVIIRELLKQNNKPEKGITLVKRVKKLKIKPFLTREGLSWEVMLATGQLRNSTSDAIKLADDMSTSAESFALMARREKTEEQNVLLSEAHKEVLASFGFPENISKDHAQALLAAKSILEKMFPILPEEMKSKFEGINWNLSRVYGS